MKRMKDTVKGRMHPLVWILLPLLPLLFAGRICAREEAGPKPPLTLTLSVEEGELHAELRNVSDEAVGILTRVDPEYGVMPLLVMDRENKRYECKTTREWIVQEPKDIVLLEPGKNHRCVISVKAFELPPGEYAIRATYRVTKDTCFFFSRPAGILKVRVEKLWFGSVVSNPVMLTVKEGQSSAQPEEKDGVGPKR